MLCALLLLLLGLAFLYVHIARMFKRDYVVEINGRRISPWICSAVFQLWSFGMALSFHALSLVPRILKLLISA
jgi:hypothetical protein